MLRSGGMPSDFDLQSHDFQEKRFSRNRDVNKKQRFNMHKLCEPVEEREISPQ